MNVDITSQPIQFRDALSADCFMITVTDEDTFTTILKKLIMLPAYADYGGRIFLTVDLRLRIKGNAVSFENAEAATEKVKKIYGTVLNTLTKTSGPGCVLKL